VGSRGDDRVNGTAGPDVIFSRWDDQTLRGLGGDDLMCGHSDMYGGLGDDRMAVRSEQAFLDMSVLSGGPGSDEIHRLEAVTDDPHFELFTIGGPGSDRLYGGRNLDSLHGGSGRDRIFGSGMTDELHGGTGRDYLVGGGASDLLRGYSGNDRLVGRARNDELRGGRGDDVARGGPGDDAVHGSPGDDTLWGGVGADLAAGGVGMDFCRAEAREDCEL
jgi:Ca2+-binding RTX toxin-like protein